MCARDNPQHKTRQDNHKTRQSQDKSITRQDNHKTGESQDKVITRQDKAMPSQCQARGVGLGLGVGVRPGSSQSDLAGGAGTLAAVHSGCVLALAALKSEG